MGENDPCEWTIWEFHRLMGRGLVSATEYLETLGQRAQRTRALNAIAHDNEGFTVKNFGHQRASSGSGSLLRDVPLVVKDSIDTADAPTTAGTGALAGHTPATDAPAVHRLRVEGAIIVGKATMHELSYGVTSNNGVSGAVHNPFDPSLIPGGSSGGTAVAVAAGIVPAGLGADTGGSVRLPAALCGVVGFRPTVGRYPSSGVVPLSHTRDTIGPIARCVSDVQTLDSVLAQSPPLGARTESVAGVRLGVPAQFLLDLEAGVYRAVHRALDTLADAGAILVDIDFDDVLAAAGTASPTLVAYEMQRDLHRYLDSHGYRLSLADLRAGIGSPDVQRLWDLNSTDRAPTTADYNDVLRAREQGRARYQQLMTRHKVEALVQPTTPLAARPIGEDRHVELRGRQVPTFATFIRHTDLAGTLGLPGISLPAGLTGSALPVGLELEGIPGKDADLLSLAGSIEALLPARTSPYSASGARVGTRRG